jgi:hypothetical protein
VTSVTVNFIMSDDARRIAANIGKLPECVALAASRRRG